MSPPQSRRTIPVFLVALLLVALTAACGGDGADAATGGDGGAPAAEAPAGDSAGGRSGASGPTVSARGLVFRPARIEIAVGATVTWTFDDRSVAHNVVGDGLKSPLKRSGEYRHTFDEPGTYEYRCTVHPGMKGSVVVS